MTNPAWISVAAYRASAEPVWRTVLNEEPEETARLRKAWNRIMDAMQELVAETDNPDRAFVFLDEVGTLLLGFELARQGVPVDAAVAHKTKCYANVLTFAMAQAQEALVATAGRA